MATIKAKFRASKVEGKMGTIFYQIIHSRVIRQINTDKNIFLNEWDFKSSNIIIDKNNPERAKELQLISDKIDVDIRRLYKLEKYLEKRGQMNNCDDLVIEYLKQPKSKTVFEFFESQIERMYELERNGTADNYVSTYKSFYRFRDGRDLVIDKLHPELIQEYEQYLKNNEISMNTISFYMRALRAVYNKAVDQGIVEQHQPFKRVYTGVERTVKRAITLNDIKRIKEYDLCKKMSCAYSRDMFLFSFYTRGMSFVDMAYLRKKDVNNGVLSYRRRKTGQLLHIKWERCMQDIVDRYSIEDSIYLLPIIREDNKNSNTHITYKSELSKVNYWLKKISKNIKLNIPLTMYVARHSWASAARTKNIPISIISEGMGHDSETTTQIYLASLDTAVIDRANRLILRCL